MTLTRVSRRTREVREDLPVRDPGTNVGWRSYVFYGRAGTGKTTLASTFPKPVLIVDCRDDGDDSVSDVKDLKVRDVTSIEELEETYRWLRDNPKAYKTVVIDTITQVQQILIEEISGKSAKRSGKQPGDWGTMTKAQWGKVSSKLKSLITDFRDLPMNVVFLAQQRVFNVDVEDGTDGEIDPEVGPNLTQSTMSHLCGAVKVIGNTFIRSKTIVKRVDGKKTEKEVVEYCVRLGPTSSYITKIRKPKSIRMPAFVSDPTYEDILEIIEGE